MGYDVRYSASTSQDGPDNVLGDDNNYETHTGAASKVGRCVTAWYKDIDGEGMGNRAWELLEREQDTPSNRQLLVYHTEQALKWLVDNKEIAELVVEADDPLGLTGVGLLVSFKDTRTGDSSTLGFIAPWGLS
jgi:phage gp46-like protein